MNMKCVVFEFEKPFISDTYHILTHGLHFNIHFCHYQSVISMSYMLFNVNKKHTKS